jgi:VanZ family protein
MMRSLFLRSLLLDIHKQFSYTFRIRKRGIIIRYFIKYWLPVIIWMGVIFWMSTGMFSSENTSQIIVPVLNFLYPDLVPHHVDMIHGLVRKTGHVIEYFLFGILFFLAFRSNSLQKWCPRWTIYSIIGVVCYAVSDEFHQIFVFSRTASLVDVGIDSAGGILSQIAIIFRWKIMR